MSDPKTRKTKKGKKVAEVAAVFEKVIDDLSIELPMAPISLVTEVEAEPEPQVEPEPFVTVHPAIARMNRFLPGGRRFF